MVRVQPIVPIGRNTVAHPATMSVAGKARVTKSLTHELLGRGHTPKTETAGGKCELSTG